MDHLKPSNLAAYLEAVFGRIEPALCNPAFDESQRTLLSATFSNYRQRAMAHPFSEPLAIFYSVAKAWREALDEQAEYLGAYCLLYILALDLIDDVQDDDLSGKPHEQAGPAIALNSGLTLLFLGLDFLNQAIRLEPSLERRTRYFTLFNRISLLAVSGQHRDLMGSEGVHSPEQVLDMQQAKTSSLALVAESAAVYAGCDDGTLAAYRQAAENMILMVQIVDDLRDIFGKSNSPDLATGKLTFPLACFMEMASETQKGEFDRLIEALPHSIKDIRKLLYETGAVRRSAEAIERFRLDVHRSLAELGSGRPTHRTWLHLVDSLAGTLYEVALVEESRFMFCPEGEWHDHVRGLANDFLTRTAPFSPPELPILLPWHLPQWMYEPTRRVIFYPDLDGLPEEVLPLQSALMGVEDLALVKGVLVELAPVVMAHEFFHYWRDDSGNLSEDAWYEEWAANRLAIAYIKTYRPDLIEKTLELANRVLSLHPAGIGAQGRQILARMFEASFQPSAHARGYEVGLSEMAFIQLSMVTHLYQEDIVLEAEVSRLLTPKQAEVPSLSRS